MKYTGNNFTIDSLELLISQINRQLLNSHSRAVELYPNASYQALDGLSVDLGQLKVTVSLHTKLKKFELGITANEEHIEYLNQRLSELESFYLIANDTDSQAIEKSILEIKQLLISAKKANYKLKRQPFELPLEDSFLELVKQFSADA
jgi:hypothetical protein